jgi:23S rRNA pseudouridine1911/1915/1917 synthase
MRDQASTVMIRSWRVSDDRAETRLDTFVRQCLPHLSRRTVAVAIDANFFRVNNRIGRKGDKLLAGDQITFKGPGDWLLRAPMPVSQPRFPVPIVYEDDVVMVVDKPAGMATHGFSGRDQDTLANFLAAKHPDLLAIGKSRWEPGLVHRLDRETSGLVLVAKTQAAFDDLRLQFRRRRVKKKYWALVWGIAEDQGSVAYPITHDSRDKRRMQAIVRASPRSRRQKSWMALTRFRKLWDVNGLSLMEIEMETGVTHQIRVHLAAIGHPIVGDKLYGENNQKKLRLERQFLHAYFLEFLHPEDRRLVKCESELPVELKDVLGRLKPMR